MKTCSAHNLKSVAAFACKAILVFLTGLLLADTASAQNGVRIAATAGAADPSAMLEVLSVTKGFLAPRMTAAQRAAIATPAEGLLVYQTDGTEGFYYFDGSSWLNLLNGAFAETDPQVSSSASNRVPKWNGSTLVDGLMTDDGVGVQLAATNFQEGGELRLQQASGGGTGDWVFDNFWSGAGGNKARIWHSSTFATPITMMDDGRVGIGNFIWSDQPSTQLHVKGGFRLENGTQGAGKVLTSSADGTGSWTDPASLAIAETDPQVSSSTTNIVPKWNGTTLTDGSIFDNGNVGINTATPSTKLHVRGNDEILTLDEVAANNLGTGALMLFKGRTSALTTMEARIGLVPQDNIYPYRNGALEIRPQSRVNFYKGFSVTNANDITMTLLSSGNVGIGTESPTQTLDVDGQVRIRGGAPGAGKVLTSSADGTGTWTDAASLAITETDPQVSSSSSNIIPKWNGTTLVDGSIFDNGNVGIGTTVAPKQLSVNQAQVIGQIGSGFNQVESGRLSFEEDLAFTGGPSNGPHCGFQFYLNGSDNKFHLLKGCGSYDTAWTVYRSPNYIGIYTSTPTSTLDINGTVRIRGGSPGVGKVLTSSADGTGTWTDAASLAITETDPQVSSATTNIVPKWNGTTLTDGTIFDNGNVGIGTNSPASFFHISSSGSGSFMGGDPAVLLVETPNHNPWSMIFRNSTAGVLGDFGIYLNNSGNLYFANSPSGSGFLDRLTINANGNVGIATSFPTQALDIDGQVRIRGGSPGVGKVLTSSADGTGSWTDPASLAITETDPQVSSATTNTVPKWNGTTLTDGSIFDNGNVGIGTSTPSYKLTVSEDASFNSVRVGRGAGNVFTNTAVGASALNSNTTGQQNTAVGISAMSANLTGANNTAMGLAALQKSTGGHNNVAIGTFAQWENLTGSQNVAMGGEALRLNTGGSNNTAVGFNAGRSAAGSGNVFLGYLAGQNETGSNKLYIDNSNTASPLIYGDFGTNLLRVNGSLNINNAYTMPTTGGSAGQVLTTNGAGTASWQSPAAGGLADWAFLSGFGFNVTSAYGFISVAPQVTITSSSQKVHVTATKAMGSTAAGGASDLDLVIAFNTTGASTPVTTVGGAILDNRCAPNTRQNYTMSAIVTGLAPGNYYFGLAAKSGSAANWNSNEWSYVSIMVLE